MIPARRFVATSSSFGASALLFFCAISTINAAPASPQITTPSKIFVAPVTRYEIDMADRTYKPRDIIKLKQLILQRYPKAKFHNVELRNAQVVAKSRLGKGRIALRIGNAISEPATIPGTEEKFASIDANSFSSVSLKNNTVDHRGKWQIFVGGYIKFRRIVLEVVSKNAEI